MGLGDFTGGFCRSAPGKSTQVRGKRSPMSPLTVRKAHVHAIPSHSVTHRQPEKRGQVSDQNGGEHGWAKAHRHRTRVLTLMTGSSRRNPLHSLIRLHLSQAACFSSNEGYSRLFKSARHPRKELKLTIALCAEDYSLQV